MSDSVPGWYADPVTPSQQRYWDGTQWTEHIAGLPQPALPTPPPGYAPTPTPTPPPYTGYGMPAYAAPLPPVTYAHWRLRVGAFLLDYLFQIPFIVANVLLSHVGNNGGNSGNSGNSTASRLSLLFLLAGLAFVIWNLYVRQGRTGYSLGKQIVGIKLIKEQTGEPIGAWPAFGRNLLHILDELPFFLGFLWPLWDAKCQTFADKIVGSVVIVAPNPRNARNPKNPMH